MLDLKEMLEEFDLLIKEITIKADNPSYHTDYDLMLISKLDNFLLKLKEAFPEYYTEKNFSIIDKHVKSIYNKCLNARKSNQVN